MQTSRTIAPATAIISTTLLILAGLLAPTNDAGAGELEVVTNQSLLDVAFSDDATHAAWATSGGNGYYWTHGVTMTDLIVSLSQSYVTGMSGDGITVVGHTAGRAWYWRSLDHLRVELPYNTVDYRASRATDASTNGNRIVGAVDRQGNGSPLVILWNRLNPTSPTIINPLPGDAACFPVAISGNGQVVVGDSTIFNNGDYHTAFVYREGASPAVEELPPLSGNNYSSASGLSRDGLWAIGVSTTYGSAVYRGVVWNTQTRGASPTPELYRGENFSPLAISADGGVVVGNTFDPTHTFVTVAVWRRNQGEIRELNELAADLGIDVDGWVMDYAIDVSADGKVFACAASRPLGAGTQRCVALIHIDCFDGPVINSEPADLTACASTDVEFSFGISSASMVDYLWQKDGNPIDGELNPTALTATLTIVDAQPGDVGTYNCVASNDCGQRVSRSATLSVFSVATGDGNADGLVDGRDVQAFVEFLLGNVAASPGYCALDFDADGVVSLADAPLFVSLLLGS